MEEMLITGRNTVDEALSSGRKVLKLYAQSSLKNTANEQIRKAKEQKIPITWVSRETLQEMTHSHHQGLVAVVEGYAYTDIEVMLSHAQELQEAPFLIMTDGIQDPHNLGAVIRTAETAGAHGVIIPKNRSVGLTYAVAKTAVGALEYVPVACVPNLVRTLDDLKKKGLWAVCADMDGDLLYEKDLTGPVVLVIGGEHEGVSHLLRTHCDMTVRLPMAGKITSLNASVAAGVVMYEIVRQRFQSGLKGTGGLIERS